LAQSLKAKKKQFQMSGGAKLMWVEKYRPENPDEIMGHQAIITTIKRLVEKDRLPHLLFYGPPGTGKTTTGINVAKMVSGKAWRHLTLELNASDERGIGVVRDRIKTFASTQQMFNKGLKLVILDEADAMTKDAQFAMRRIMEQYTKNTRFILICNYVNRIIPAIQSRCTRFRFSPLEKKSIEERLRFVAEQEGVNCDESGISTIVNLCEGDMRKCLNILQSTAQSFPIVNSENVHTCTGAPAPEVVNEIFDLLFQSTFKDALEKISAIMTDKGVALSDLLPFIHERIKRTKIGKVSKSKLIYEFGELEERLSHAATDSLQIAGFVGLFFILKHDMEKETKKE